MFDVMEIEFLNKPKKVYAFLNLSWGIISDIDLESEKIRCFGTMRFTCFGFYLWAWQRNIYGTLYYTTEDKIDKDFKFPNLKEKLDPKYFTKETSKEIIKINFRKLFLFLCLHGSMGSGLCKHST